MKYLSTVFFLCIQLISARAQQPKIDSLLQVNSKPGVSDSTKILNYLEIIKIYTRAENFAKLKEYATKAIALGKLQTNALLLTRVYERVGLSWHGKSRYLDAIDMYNAGLAVSQKAGIKKQEAMFYTDLGSLYGSLPDFPKSLENTLKAIDIFSALNDQENLANQYMNAASVYSKINQGLVAYNYIQKALPSFQAENDGFNYGNGLACLSQAQLLLDMSDADLKQLSVEPSKRYNLCLTILLKTANIAKKAQYGNYLEGPVNQCLGKTYERMNQPAKALQHYQQGLENFKLEGETEQYNELLNTIGEFYRQQNDFTNAEKYLKQGLTLAKENLSLNLQQGALVSLSELSRQQNKYEVALDYYRQYTVIKDTIFNQEKEKEITRKQMQIDFTLKENDYKIDQQLINSRLQQQVLLAKQQQQEIQLKQQQLQLINKEKDLQQLAYLQKQATLQKEKEMQEQLNAKNELQAQYDKAIRDKKINSQQNQISTDKNIKLGLGVVISLIALIAGIIFFNQRRTKKLNKIISEQKQSLEELGQVKDKIFSVVSHDMRGPVNSLISFTDLLENGDVPQEKLVQYSKTLKQNLTQTSSMMNNLLNWSASQLKGFTPVTEPIGLHSLVNEFPAILQHHLEQKQVHIHNHIPADLIVNSDKNMLAAILRNLISNAIKFSYKEGEVVIEASTTGNKHIIMVTDSGMGMDASQTAIFNHAAIQQTVSKRGTDNESGTGLGLLLCKTFVAQLNGTIKAEPREKGSRFIVTLPV